MFFSVEGCTHQGRVLAVVLLLGALISVYLVPLGRGMLIVRVGFQRRISCFCLDLYSMLSSGFLIAS